MLVNEKEAQSLLRQGRVIGIPTETVFGVAADAVHEPALLELYNLKKRERQKPVVVQLGHKNDVLPFLSHIPYDLEKLMDQFWPGALTLVLPVHEEKISGLIRANKPFVGFRVTAHNEVRRFISDYGPLAVTSANFSGEKDLLSVKEVEQAFGESFPILACEQKECLGVASTVLAYVDASWVILRLGALKLEVLKHVLGYYPPVVSQLDLEAQTFDIRPQLHLRDVPYDGSIEVVLGFSNKTYSKAQKVLHLGDLNELKEVKKQMLSSFQEIQRESYPHIWVDLDFPKEGELKQLAELLEHAARGAH